MLNKKQSEINLKKKATEFANILPQQWQNIQMSEAHSRCGASKCCCIQVYKRKCAIWDTSIDPYRNCRYGPVAERNIKFAGLIVFLNMAQCNRIALQFSGYETSSASEAMQVCSILITIKKTKNKTA